MPSVDSCILGQQNKLKVEQLEKSVIEVRSDIKEIKEQLLGRPSWPVMTLLIVAAKAIAIMATYIAIKMNS